MSICLPNDLHAPTAIAALKAGKHVLCETPPALSLGDAKKMAAAAEKSGKTLLYAAQRRFGGAEQAAQQAIAKDYIGEVRHVRASWMRMRGTPAGTGWYTDKARSGGGALLDLGAPMLDLAWYLMGQPEPQGVFAVASNHLIAGKSHTGDDASAETGQGVESAALHCCASRTGGRWNWRRAGQSTSRRSIGEPSAGFTPVKGPSTSTRRAARCSTGSLTRRATRRNCR